MRCLMTLNEGRGRDPGDTAQLVVLGGVGLPSPRSLNEGRGRDPGDTPRSCYVMLCRQFNSLNEGRGRDPGDTTSCASGRSDPVTRSTKAGAETPATHHVRTSDSSNAREPLNEGRGRDPGDTHRSTCPAQPGRPRPTFGEV